MDIQTKDGILLRGIPDGTPDDVIKERINKIREEGVTGAPKDKGFIDSYKDLAAGALTSAQHISNTLMTPVNKAIDKFQGNPEVGIGDRNQAVFDAGIANNADTNSTAFKGGKLAGDIGFTMPLGGVVAKPLSAAAPYIGKAAPYVEKLANAIRSGGFNLGGAPATTALGSVGNGLTRVAGGAINGGVSAGAINPEDAEMGAGIGAAFPVVGKVAGSVGSGVGTVVKPLYQGGKNKILADFLLDKAGSNSDEVINSLRTAKGNTPGFNPTVGQASNSPELATAERVFRERNPGLFGDVNKEQNKALAASINSIGGDDIARQGALDARQGAVEGMYGQAANKPVNMTPELQSLTQRPSMQEAIKRAQNLAAENGEAFDLNAMNGKSAQYLKMAMDDITSGNPMSGISGNELRAAQGTKQSYLNQLDQQIPEYLQANAKYAEMSKPINQIDLGNSIRDKYIPALYRDLEVPPELRHAELAKILKDNGDKLAQSSTGFKGATLEGTLRPEQLEAVKNAVKDAQYIKQGQLSGKPVNSSTFQNLAFDGQMGGGVLPEMLKNFAPASITGNIVKAGRDLVYKGSNEQLAQQLAEALTNPAKAAELMTTRLTASQKNKAIATLLKSPSLVSGTAAISAQ